MSVFDDAKVAMAAAYADKSAAQTVVLNNLSLLSFVARDGREAIKLDYQSLEGTWLLNGQLCSSQQLEDFYTHLKGILE
jgi:hypothetical protein